MKIAVLSDIHGNLAALDAVLAHIEEEGVDVVVNLGDIVSGSLEPSETADRLMPLGLPTIQGNHERQVLTLDPACMGPSDRRAYDTLRADQRAWLAALPATLRLTDDVLLVHGTPESDLHYLLETVTESGCRAATQAEVIERTRHADAALILCGHTHIPRMMKLDDGRVIVNPGSVGLQAYEDAHPFAHRMETGSPHARYAVVECASGEWNARFHAVEYDWNEAARRAHSNGRADWVTPLLKGYVTCAPKSA
jgi:putative phosphoesterase